jgi:hypothetical protein
MMSGTPLAKALARIEKKDIPVGFWFHAGQF